MFKSKIKTFFILLFIFLISSTFVYAENTTITTEDVVPISEDADIIMTDEGETVEVDENNQSSAIDTSDIYQGDLYLLEDDVVVDNIVDGNLFVIGNNVTIRAQIGGDVFVMANKVTFDEVNPTTGEGGYVYSNVFVLANEINVNGVVYDLYACGTVLNIGESGYVYRDLRFAGTTLNVYGSVGRNAFVNAQAISFTNDSDASGTIYGNLDYSSEKSIDIPEGAVEGEVKFTENTITSQSNKEVILSYVLNLLSTLVFTVVIALFVSFLSNKFTDSSASKENILKNKLLLVFGIGLAGLIGGLVVLPILVILLLTTVLGAKVGLILLCAFLFLMALSTTIFNITASDLITAKFNITKKFIKYLVLLGVTTCVWLLSQIPYIGVFVSFLAMILGFGVILLKLFGKNKVKNNEIKPKAVEISEVKEIETANQVLKEEDNFKTNNTDVKENDDKDEK